MTTNQSPTVLSCSDLTMRFGGLTALNRLSLHVNRGEILGLLGPNGSGKTTFFNVVTGLYRATSGQVDFGGNEVSTLAPQKIYRLGITRTFQRSRLCLPLTVFDNVMIGNHQHLNHGMWFNLFRRKAFREQFERNVEDARTLVQTFNPKLVDRLFDEAGSCNMIDRRRIEICRALVSRPKLLLLDEPSAGMTHEETRELMEDIMLVQERIPDLTIIIIEHEMNMIERITDRCIVLSYGEKICDGVYAEVIADRQVQEAYLGQS
jgi:branched-chain amino acid transport system ATP-binding protein